MSKLPQISEAEFEVMKVIWKYAPISTNEVTEKTDSDNRLESKDNTNNVEAACNKKSAYL